MKLSSPSALATALLLASTTTTAAPLPTDTAVPATLAGLSAPGFTLRPISPLLRRDGDEVCSNISELIATIGTSKGALVWASSTFTGYYSAKAVCKRLDKNSDNCDDIAKAIAGGISVVFASVNYNYNGDADAVQSRDVGSGVSGMATAVHAALLADGHTFGGVHDITQHVLGQYGPDDRKPLQVTRIAGLIHTASNHTGDYDVYDFGDGEGHVHVAPSAHLGTTDSTGSAGSAGPLEKRVDGAGFKISFTTRLGSLLSAQHKVDMADEIALYWAMWAKGTVRSGGYTYYNKDLIGFVETGHLANFYFRVSAEVAWASEVND